MAGWFLSIWWGFIIPAISSTNTYRAVNGPSLSYVKLGKPELVFDLADRLEHFTNNFVGEGILYSILFFFEENTVFFSRLFSIYDLKNVHPSLLAYL